MCCVGQGGAVREMQETQSESESDVDGRSARAMVSNVTFVVCIVFCTDLQRFLKIFLNFFFDIDVCRKWV